MNRTPLPKHALSRSPYNQIAAALALASLFGAYLLLGGIAVIVVIVLWIVGLVAYGRVFGKRSFEEVARRRAQDEASHRELLRGRAAHAAREGMAYEEESAELAAAYGRVEQDVPENTPLPFRARARHTAGLTAEGVVRGERGGFPCTVFDLALVNEVDLGELRSRGPFDQAVESATDYVTVCAVTLPFALPYVSAQAAWENSDNGDEQAAPDVPREQRHSEDPELARLLLSVPAVREAALTPDLLWVVRGDRLIAAAMSGTGLGSDEAFGRLDALTALAAAFPWDRLEPFRQQGGADAARLWGPSRSPLLVYQWWNAGGFGGDSVLRWGHQPLGTTGLYQLSSVGLHLGDKPG